MLSAVGLMFFSTAALTWVTNSANPSEGTPSILGKSPENSANPLSFAVTSFSVSPSTVSPGATVLFKVTVTGGVPPYSYMSCFGNYNTSSTSISLPCTAPVKWGFYQYYVSVSDSTGALAMSNPASIQVTDNTPLPEIVSFTVSPSQVSVNQSSTLTVTASQGVPPYTYGYSGLPPGCVSGNKSSIICTPDEVGSSGTGGFLCASNGSSCDYSVGVTVWDDSCELPPCNSVVGSAYLLVYGKAPPTLNLYSISVSPSTITIQPGENYTFTASPGCGFGGCPNVSYTWQISDGFGLGRLRTTQGQRVEFMAGSGTGTVTITVDALGNGGRVFTASATITIATDTAPTSQLQSIPPWAIVAVAVILVVLGAAFAVHRRRKITREESSAESTEWGSPGAETYGGHMGPSEYGDGEPESWQNAYTTWATCHQCGTANGLGYNYCQGCGRPPSV